MIVASDGKTLKFSPFSSALDSLVSEIIIKRDKHVQMS